MSLTATQVAEMEAAKFLDANFGQLDLSGCPTCLQQPSEEDELPDPRFAPLDNSGPGFGAAALKRGIEEMLYDPEVQQQLARETEDPNVLADIQQQAAERVAREFRRLNPDYFRSHENWEAIVQCMAFNCLGWESDEATVEEAQDELIRAGHWTLANLTAAFRELSREGALETDPEQPRLLSEQQRRSIALQASAGDIDGALTRYLQARLPEHVAAQLTDTFGMEDVFDQLADPQWKRVIEEAVWFCWQFGRPNYAPTKERKQFMQSYVAGRIPTARLLDEAWKVCQEDEKDVMRSAILSQASERDTSAPDLDSLSDEEINSLYRGALRRVAKEAGYVPREL